MLVSTRVRKRRIAAAKYVALAALAAVMFTPRLDDLSVDGLTRTLPFDLGTQVAMAEIDSN
ncbi:MAG TPA: hypothetical protein VIL88_04775 [Devosia sp.]|jgi:uncharacterized membrane protein YdfJ with MMPL/SSD domain|uniref:hypothetical protein n=1 Tax=Devosia sp. TaxID=1871048 RepID=UPI002F93910A